MNQIPPNILTKVQSDFDRLNKDGNNVLNIENDKISKADGEKFFIDLNKDIDIETFYQYNADKYGESLTDAYFIKREQIKQAYNEIKGKEKPSLELQASSSETRIDSSDKAMVEKFYSNPQEGMVYNYKGYDIVYKDGKYSCPKKSYIEPAKFIQGITFHLNQEITEELYNRANSLFGSAQTKEEKDSIVKEFVYNLLKTDGQFDYDYLIANNNPGTSFSKTRRIGIEEKNIVKINFTLGEKEVILNNFEYFPEDE